MKVADPIRSSHLEFMPTAPSPQRMSRSGSARARSTCGPRGPRVPQRTTRRAQEQKQVVERQLLGLEGRLREWDVDEHEPR